MLYYKLVGISHILVRRVIFGSGISSEGQGKIGPYSVVVGPMNGMKISNEVWETVLIKSKHKIKLKREYRN
jgi:hypothetical protein